MDDDTHVAELVLSGHAEMVTPNEPLPEDTIVAFLNEKAEALAEGIERDLQRRLQRFRVTVQAEVQFEVGSVEMAATVLLMWTGRVIASAARDEFAKQLGGIVRLTVQRAVNRTMRSIAPGPAMRPMRVDEPDLVRVSTLEDRKGTASAPEPTKTAATSELRPIVPDGATNLHRWTFLAVLALLLLNLLLVLDRFVIIQVRP
jgi:hypothetical protein